MNNLPPVPAQGWITRFLPGLALLRGYRKEWLSADVFAGVSVCVVMVPSVIAYSGLMGLPPQHGLYAALVSLLLYPFFGSSRHMIVGPDIAISLLIAGTIGPLAKGDPKHAAALAGVIALLSGFLLLLGARAKLGAVADFLSQPVLVGYMTGAALILMVSQANTLFGLSLKHLDFFPRLLELAGSLKETHWPTLVLGGALLALAIGLKRFAAKIPAALAVCTVAIVASSLWNMQQLGIAVVGPFPHGLPGFSLPSVEWKELDSMLPAAVGVALLTYAEGILLARAFAAKHGYELNANDELNALGIADLGAGLFQGFAVTGSQARTTLGEATGSKTQVASLAAAAALMLFLAFLTPLISRLPQVALAVLLLQAAFSLIELKAIKRIYQIHRHSAVLAGLTTLSVLIGGVVPGIVFGVALSLLGLINRISHPPDAVLSEIPGRGFHDLGATSARNTIPGLIAYRFYAPLLFSNVGHFIARVRKLIAENAEPVRWLLLDAQAIPEIDVTAVEALRAFHAELLKQGISLKIAHANRPLRDWLERSGLKDDLGEESFFHSVHECVEAFQRTTT